MKQEVWKAVAGFEGRYEVSSHGRVRGLDRYVAHSRKGTVLWKGRILRQTILGNNGYLGVSLCADGVRYVRTVHSLVATAFHGLCPRGYETAHLDGNRRNNAASNLGWKTRTENHADKRRHGTLMRGTGCPWAKLTDGLVRRMRRWRAAGQTYEQIGLRAGVTRRTASRAISGEHWAHV